MPLERLVEERLRRLQIRCRRPVEHLLSGAYRSVFKGRGLEFDELREYQYGDDVRAIDWRSLARTNKPHIRRYVEEREQVFILALDISASCAFGSGPRSKREAAQEVAALLAWSAVRNNDRVGLLLFSDRVELFIPPARGRRHVLQAVSEMINHQPRRVKTDLGPAMDFISRVVPKRGIVFLLSDFLCTDYADPMRVLAFRHDLTAVLIRDPVEQQLPADGLVEMRDAESGAQRLIEVKRGRRLPDTAVKTLQEIAASAEIDWFEIGPHIDGVEALSAFFQTRHQRLVGESGG